MELRFLGGTGVKVSRLALGCMSWGGDADEATATAMFARARDAGVNLFDTADVYNQGRSEEILLPEWKQRPFWEKIVEWFFFRLKKWL